MNVNDTDLPKQYFACTQVPVFSEIFPLTTDWQVGSEPTSEQNGNGAQQRDSR